MKNKEEFNNALDKLTDSKKRIVLLQEIKEILLIFLGVITALFYFLIGYLGLPFYFQAYTSMISWIGLIILIIGITIMNHKKRKKLEQRIIEYARDMNNIKKFNNKNAAIQTKTEGNQE